MSDSYKDTLLQIKTSFASENYTTAVKLCRQALILKPDSIEAMDMGGVSYMMLDEAEKAEQFFRDGIRLDDSDGERYFNLGSTLFAQDNVHEGVEAYSKAIQKGCSDEITKKIHYVIGAVQQEAGDRKNAMRHYDQAEKLGGLDEDDLDILLKKTELLIAEKRYQEAEDYACQLKLLLPGQFEVYHILFQLAVAQQDLHKAENTLKEMDRDLKDTKENVTAQKFEWVMLDCYKAELDEEKQQEHYMHAVERLRDIAQNIDITIEDRCEAAVTAGDIYLKLDNVDKAENLFRWVAGKTDPAVQDYIDRTNANLAHFAEERRDYQALLEYSEKLKTCENEIYKNIGYYDSFKARKELAKTRPELAGEARDAYKLAIAYYKSRTMAVPGDMMAQVYRARAYADMGERVRAEKLAELLPESVQEEIRKYLDADRKEE